MLLSPDHTSTARISNALSSPSVGAAPPAALLPEGLRSQRHAFTSLANPCSPLPLLRVQGARHSTAMEGYVAGYLTKSQQRRHTCGASRASLRHSRTTSHPSTARTPRLSLLSAPPAHRIHSSIVGRASSLVRGGQIRWIMEQSRHVFSPLHRSRRSRETFAPGNRDQADIPL